MKILHVIPYMHPRAGGPPVVVDRVCSQLAKLGCETVIATTNLMEQPTDNNWISHWETAKRIRVYPVDKQTNFARSRAFVAALPQLVAEADLVHLHTLWNSPTKQAARTCRATRTPYVVMPHGMLDPHSMQRGRWKKSIYGTLFEFPALRRAAGMIYTHAEEERLARTTVRQLPRGFITPLGADTPPDSRDVLTREFLARFPALRERQLVLFLSRLHEKKGLDLLIPAFRQVREQNPQAHLLLVGSGTPEYEQQLRSWVSEAQLEQAVTFTGTLSGRDKWGAMSAASVFVLPSYQENFALVVVDALAVGLPVVLSRRVNIHDDVVSAGAGLSCDLNPTDIATKIVQQLGDEQSLHAAGLAGKRLVAEQFTWNGCAERLLQTYHDVLGQQVRA